MDHTKNKASVMWRLLRLSSPILIASMVEALIPFINMILAGQQSALALAAAGLAGNTFASVLGFACGIMISVAILTSHQLGHANEVDKTGAILKASFITAFVLSVPVMILMKFVKPLWLFFGQSPELAQLGQAYLDGLLWLIFADLVKFSIFQFAIAHDRASIPLMANILSIPLSWILNKVLIARWGLFGLGLGTSLAHWFILVLLVIYLYQDALFQHCLTVPVSWSEYWIHCKEQFQLGIPMGAMSSIELFFFTVIGLLMGQLSINHLVSHQIAMQWLCFTIMIAVGFSEAITILVAKARARRHFDDAWQFLQSGVVLTTGVMLAISCIYWFAPHLVIHLDLSTQPHHEKAMQLTVTTLSLCGFFQIFDAIRIVLSGALRGLADTQYPMWITLIAFWGIGLPAAYITAFILKWENTGLWIGMILSVLVMIALQYRRIQVRLSRSQSN